MGKCVGLSGRTKFGDVVLRKKRTKITPKRSRDPSSGSDEKSLKEENGVPRPYLEWGSIQLLGLFLECSSLDDVQIARGKSGGEPPMKERSSFVGRRIRKAKERVLEDIPEEVQPILEKQRDSTESNSDFEWLPLAPCVFGDDEDECTPYIPYVPYEKRILGSIVLLEKDRQYFIEAIERRVKKIVVGELEKK